MLGNCRNIFFIYYCHLDELVPNFQCSCMRKETAKGTVVAVNEFEAHQG